MSDHVNDGKRGFLKTAMLGAGAGAFGAAAAPGVTLAQMPPRRPASPWRRCSRPTSARIRCWRRSARRA